MSATCMKNALGLASVAALVALCICVGLDLFSYFNVHRDVITALTGTFSGCGVGYVACRVGDDITARVFGRLDRVNDRLDRIDVHLADLPGAIENEVEERLTEEQLAEMRGLASRVNGRQSPRLRSVAE